MRRLVVFWLILGLSGLGACGDDSSVGDPDGSHQLPDGSARDGGQSDSTIDAAVDANLWDAWVRPPGDAFVLPDSSLDGFVHPGPTFGPALVINSLELEEDDTHSLYYFSTLVNDQLQQALDEADLLFVLEFHGLHSLTGTIDATEVTVVIYRAVDADAFLSNNFTGSGEFLVDMDSATVIAGATVTSGHLLIPAGTFQYLDVEIPGFGTMVVMNPEISGDIQTNFAGLQNGHITGAVPSRSMDVIPNQTGMGNANGSLLDFLVTSVFEVQPDIDIDGDNHLETFDDFSPLSPTWDGLISMCHDFFGDIDDDDCPQHAYIWDGYSVSMLFTAVPCTIVGLAP